jgi:hypothetical protein
MRAASSLFAVSAVLALAASAHAAWGPEPTTIVETMETISRVEACSDGAFGTLVAWQQDSVYSYGVLRALHVLPDGTPDPAWPAAGTLVCPVPSGRAWLRVVPDAAGGLYAGWLEGTSFYVNRVTAQGAIAGGWPARGRLVATMTTAYPPQLVADGTGGIYVAWHVDAPSFTDPYRILAMHLGPANTAIGGWTSARSITATYDEPVRKTGAIAAADDGGLWVAWSTCSAEFSEVPSRWHVAKRTPAGLPAPGWSSEGLDLGDFACEGYAAPAILTAVDADGEGGAWVTVSSIGYAADPDYDYWGASARVQRVDADATLDDIWPPSGVPLGGFAVGRGGDVEMRRSANGGAVVRTPYFTSHGAITHVQSVAPSGVVNAAGSGLAGGFDYLAEPSGVFVAEFSDREPFGPYQPNCAYLRVQRCPGWDQVLEQHCSSMTIWYGDIALASTGDGGAVFFWSQQHERHGLFARRFGPQGMTTAVEPNDAGAPAFHAFHRPARGIVVRAASAATTPASIGVFDLQGRRVASATLEAGARETLVPGTADLRSAVYFVRLAGASATKVLVGR